MTREAVGYRPRDAYGETSASAGLNGGINAYHLAKPDMLIAREAAAKGVPAGLEISRSDGDMPATAARRPLI